MKTIRIAMFLAALMLSATVSLAQHLRPGRYVIESNVNRHYCLDLESGKVSSFSKIWCYSYNGGNAQIWDVVENGDGTYSIYNCQSDRDALAHEPVMRDGSRLRLSLKANRKDQRWYMEPHGDSYVIRSATSREYVIDLNAGRAADTQPITLWHDNGTYSQRWHFRPYDRNNGGGYGHGGNGSYGSNHGGYRVPRNIPQPRMQVIDAGGEVALTVPREILDCDVTSYYWDVNESSKIYKVETNKSGAILRGLKATPSTIVTYKYYYRVGDRTESATLPFTIRINKVTPTAISTDQETSVGLGTDASVRVWFEPKYAEGNLQFDSDNPAVVSVDGNGRLHGNSLGEANVFITSDNGLTTQTHVFCVVPPVSKLSIVGYNSDQKLYPGDQVQLSCNYSPQYAQPSLIWTSTDSTIATVDANGLVTIVGNGTVHIYCTDSKTGKKDDIKLKPKKAK